jgi:hypothetical protein
MNEVAPYYGKRQLDVHRSYTIAISLFVSQTTSSQTNKIIGSFVDRDNAASIVSAAVARTRLIHFFNTAPPLSQTPRISFHHHITTFISAATCDAPQHIFINYSAPGERIVDVPIVTQLAPQLLTINQTNNLFCPRTCYLQLATNHGTSF